MTQSVPSVPEANRSAPAPRFNWLLLAVAFIVIAAIAITKAIMSAKTTPLLDDTDDAMRLTTVRDLLNGQGWWDHIQHRLNTPFGAEIHWSHLIDAAIGGVILALRPFAGPMAETIAVYVWPLFLLALLLTLVGRLSFRLAGPEAVLPALVLAAVAPALMNEFSPGRIDHHSIQILLLLTMAWGTIETIERPRFALLTALAAGLSLAVGIEGLPNIVAALIGTAMIWVMKPERAPALRNFGIVFALTTIAVQIDQYPPSRWFEAACDEISFVYVALAVGVGACFVLLSLLPLATRRPWVRFVVGGLVGGVLVVILAKAFPLCLKGPYAALDPWLVTNWLNRISEARPIWESFVALPAVTAGAVIPPLLGLVIVIVRIWRGGTKDRGAWMILAVFLAIAVLVMCQEVRGARLAAPLALPAAGWLITRARRFYLSGHRISGIFAVLGSWLGFAGLAIALVVAAVTPDDPASTPPVAASASTPAPAVNAPAPTGREACLMPQAFTTLASLPAARVLSPIDLGSHVLLFTPHSVVAAPYHRDQAGVRDAFRFFNDPIESAHAMLMSRGVGLVVVCKGMPEVKGLAEATPDSFAKLYAKGALPSWLQQISPTGDVLTIYRVASP